MGCVHILRETTRLRVIASPSIWHSFMFQTLYSIYLCSPSTLLTSNHFSLIIQSWHTLVKAIGHYLKVDWSIVFYWEFIHTYMIQHWFGYLDGLCLFSISCFLLLLEIVFLYYLFLLSIKFTFPKKCRHHFLVYRSHFLTLVWILDGKRIWHFLVLSLSQMLIVDKRCWYLRTWRRNRKSCSCMVLRVVDEECMSTNAMVIL